MEKCTTVIVFVMKSLRVTEATSGILPIPSLLCFGHAKYGYEHNVARGQEQNFPVEGGGGAGAAGREEPWRSRTKTRGAWGGEIDRKIDPTRDTHAQTES